MKQLLLTGLLLASLGGMAQRNAGATPTTQVVIGGGGGTPAPPEYEAPLTGFADAVNAVFQAVDKSRVPSGIL